MIGKKWYGSRRGFIALFSVIIVSALLLGVVSAASMGAFFSRTNALDEQSQQTSVALSEGCVDAMLLAVAQDFTFSRVPAPLTLGDDSCNLVSVQTLNAQSTQKHIKIDATAQYGGSIAHVELLVLVQNPALPSTAPPMQVLSWQHIP